MAQPKLTTTIKTELRRIRLTTQQKAFADLLALGWIESDAYIASGLYSEAYSLVANKQKMDHLINENGDFINYLNGRISKLEKQFAKKEEKKETQQDDSSKKPPADINYREKDAIIDALSYEAQFLKGKERIDALMKIADLQQMKKEEVTDEKRYVHYYLPLTCNNCQLYINSKKKKGI